MKKQWDQGIIYWFASNPVAANLMMVCLLIGGLYSAWTMKKEMFPATSVNQVQITMAYPGAAPDEVEKGICVKVEDAVTGLEGIDKTTCVANEGFANASIEIGNDYDVKNVMAEIKNRVDGINSFPEQAEKPIISEILIQQPVLFLSVYGNVPEDNLLQATRDVRDDLIDLPDVSMASLVGSRDYEIAIEVQENTLRQYQITFDEIAQALRAASIDLPGGSIKTDRGDVLLRAVGQSYTGVEFANTIIRTNPDGSRLLLKDIANIKDGFVETADIGTFDGKPAISIQVNAVENESVLIISDQVNAYVDEMQSKLPPNMSMASWSDTSHYVRGRLDMMERNMLQGAVLVLLTLTLFLRLKVAFWVMLGLPVAFLGAFMFLPLTGISINMLSMFGFILVLGIVVDDAIVIGESAYSEIQHKGHSLKNVVVGAQRVATPATFGVLTTIAAFAPMLFVGTLFGSFFEAIGWVVILCLLFSLVESKLILPAHLAHMKSDDIGTKNPGPLLRLQRKVNSGLEYVITHWYRPTIGRAINRPGLTLTVFVGIFVLSLGLIQNNLVRFVMMPDFVADFVQADFAMAQGTPQETTEQVLNQVEEALVRLDKDVSESVGLENGAVYNHRLSFIDSQVSGKVIVELVKEENTVIDGKEMLKRWTEYIGEIPGATHIGTMSLTGPGQGPDVSLKLVGSDTEELRLAADILANKLADYEGVSDVRNSIEAGKDEIEFSIKPLGENLGLSQNDIGRQIRQAYYGEEVQRLQRGNDEVKVMLRYDRATRESLKSLDELRVRTAQGDELPLSTVAEINLGKAANSIERVNRKRAARITAMVDKAIADPQTIISELMPEMGQPIVPEYPEVTYDLDGMSKEMTELMQNLGVGMLSAVILIYVLLAIPLKSYLQPLIIMLVIPFGITGAIVGHLLLGMTFSMMSIFGVIALTGVVVNDSLVMVDYINKERNEGIDIISAVKHAGAKRFRAILLTSLTTFFGLLPIMFETSLQAKVIIPMAVSLAFGILFATVITLILIPSLYAILERFKYRFIRVDGYQRKGGTTAPVMNE
ncbi:efflux RND transporter permease subunit [Marinicella sp. S1101]|uniref:efflux RND transporter permease subunit n=1 Tax=Marinicella marina TaxID=2996016 RepID=UPI002260B9C7|nr:efflux RND transporter permease subunit [Marinicella marina]MCX7554355.1 efflux RND transporter permease subunit [Marinicella marina]MDJ1138654.1 efflux RND transporter permease subunit [Marinicella marina]